jgi:hypothetical protein
MDRFNSSDTSAQKGPHLKFLNKPTLILSSARSETFVDQPDPMENKLRGSDIFRVIEKADVASMRLCSSEVTVNYKEVAPTLPKTDIPNAQIIA